MKQDIYDNISVYAFASKEGLVQWCMDTSEENAKQYIVNRYGPFAKTIDFIGGIPFSAIKKMADQINENLSGQPVEIEEEPEEPKVLSADRFFLSMELTADKYLTEKRDKTSFRRLIGKAREEYNKQNQ